MPRVRIFLIAGLILTIVGITVSIVFNPPEAMPEELPYDFSSSEGALVAAITTQEIQGEEETVDHTSLIGFETVINSCSLDGFATARMGVEVASEQMRGIENGTKIKILQVVEGYPYDFTPTEGCGTTVRVQVEVLEGDYETQTSWVSGACVERVAK